MPATIRSFQMAVMRRFEHAVFDGRELVDPARSPGDPGVCGPHSVSWKVFNDPSCLIALMRAYQLQAAHRRVVACLYDHGSWATDARARFQMNAAFQLAVTYAAEADVVAMCAAVRRAHRAMVGTTAAGERYAANGRDELWWAYATSMQSTVVCWDVFGPGGALTAAERDQFLVEQAPIARALGVRNPPLTWDELAAGLAAAGGQLERSDAGDIVLGALARIRWPWPGTIMYRIGFAAAASTLSGQERALAGLRRPGPLARPATILLLRVANVLRGPVPIEPCRHALERVNTPGVDR